MNKNHKILQPPLDGSIARAISELFDANRTPPSHADLTLLFRHAGLTEYDPRTDVNNIGKQKRVYEVLFLASTSKPDAGRTLVRTLVENVAGSGGFDPSSSQFVGESTFGNMQRAFRVAGWFLTPAGKLGPLVLDTLSGEEMTSALAAYVARAQAGILDAALLAGTAKDLVEATARHAITERGHQFQPNQAFAGTLLYAYQVLDLQVPPGKMIASHSQNFSNNPEEAIHQLMYLLAISINTLRNKEGTGHGRPFPPTVSDQTATLSVELMGLIAKLLLSRL